MENFKNATVEEITEEIKKIENRILCLNCKEYLNDNDYRYEKDLKNQIIRLKDILDKKRRVDK